MWFWVEWALLGAFHHSTHSTPLTSALGAKTRCLGAMTKIDTWLNGSKNGCLEAPLTCLGPKTSELEDITQHGPMTKWNGP
jgi:hypothetical protein